MEQLLKKYRQLDLSESLNYERFSMYSIVWHSTKIEGCQLTELETRMLLEEDVVAGGKPLTDHLMVKDHYLAFLLVQELASQRLPITIPLLQRINAAVMHGTGALVRTVLGDFDSSRGDLRLVRVFVGKKYFPPHDKVPGLLEAFCAGVNEQLLNATGIDALNLAADVHYNFINIHPFADGNGRTARLLMNYILFYHGLPPIKIFSEDRTAYIDALNATEAMNDLTIFRAFVRGQYEKFFRSEIEKVERSERGGFTLMF